MEIDELRKTHQVYKDNAERWSQLGAAYEGIDALIEKNVFEQHPRELNNNYSRRLHKAFGFNFSATVIDLLSFYLFQAPGHTDYGDLANDQLFNMFMNDADFEGRAFDEWLVVTQKRAAIFGQVGVFVDRPAVEPGRTDNQDIEDRVYSYATYYSPLDILDWEWGINELGRPELLFLKLFDQQERYRIWTPDDWQIWAIVDGKPQLVASDVNPLGSIPFFWFVNEDIGDRVLGRSDICEIWKIDVSIIENAMQAEEIIDLDAFPQLLLDINIELPGGNELERSITGILRYDASVPNGKPDWLKQEASGAITTIMEWINEKIRNIYRAANLSGVSSNFSNQARSGESLKREFQLLNSKLYNKSVKIENAQRKIIDLWGLWQNKSTEDVVINRATEFDVEALSDELENIMNASLFVRSELFRKVMEKRVSRKVIGTGDEQIIGQIDQEIDRGSNTESGQEAVAENEG